MICSAVAQWSRRRFEEKWEELKGSTSKMLCLIRHGASLATVVVVPPLTEAIASLQA